MAAKFIACSLISATLLGGTPAWAATLHDVEYGADPAQRFDVYMPEHPQRAPVVFFVHGGGWARGDKAAPGLLDAKLAYWLPQGYVVISVDYPLLPAARPLEQARDVARALATAQSRASSYGADPRRFIVMGHSAGAHLVALIATSPSIAAEAAVIPPAAYVLLDTAALDVPAVMRARHLRLYDRAFGSDPARWPEVSPFDLLGRSGAPVPVLVVCSMRRRISCPAARAFVARAKSIGTRASLLEEDLSHAEINRSLGLASSYTDAVGAFIRGSVTPGPSLR